MSPSLFPYVSLNILWHERIYALIQWSLADPVDYKLKKFSHSYCDDMYIRLCLLTNLYLGSSSLY